MSNVTITADDIHWFESAFSAWNCNDMPGTLDGLESAVNYFIPSMREQIIADEKDCLLEVANRIVGNANPEEDDRLEIAYAISRYLKLDWAQPKP